MSSKMVGAHVPMTSKLRRTILEMVVLNVGTRIPIPRIPVFDSLLSWILGFQIALTYRSRHCQRSLNWARGPRL